MTKSADDFEPKPFAKKCCVRCNLQSGVTATITIVFGWTIMQSLGELQFHCLSLPIINCCDLYLLVMFTKRVSKALNGEIASLAKLFTTEVNFAMEY